MMSNLLKLLVLPILLHCAMGHAQTAFQVEVIIFSHKSNNGSNEETWLKNPTLAYPENTLNLQSTEDQSHNYSALPSQQLSLIDWRDRMRASGQYTILAHTAWSQPITNENNSHSILLTGGEKYDNHHQLEGSLNVFSDGKNYKVQTNLWLSKFSPSSTSTQTSTITLPTLSAHNTSDKDNPTPQYFVEKVFTMNETHTITPNKPLYIDHPVFGALVLIKDTTL